MGREEVKIAIFPSSLTHLLYVQVSGPFLVAYLSENDHFRIPPNTLFAPKALSTLMRCPRKRIDRFSSTLPFWCVFDFPHSNVRKRLNCTLWRKLNSMRMLKSHVPVIFSVIVFILMRFLSSILLQYVCVFVLISFSAFSNWFVSNGNTLVHCVQILYKPSLGEGGEVGANRVYYGDSKIENSPLAHLPQWTVFTSQNFA